MGTNIITGYTGTRHITPAMDASVYRAAFGADEYVMSDGNKLAGSMPTINDFTILDGLVSMQGHMIQVTQDTLSVDTCATGYVRVDLVCLRYNHDNSTLIDSATLTVLKGTEVQSGNMPVPPTYNTGKIDEGATVVDMPLYRIDLNGSTVTFSRLFVRSYSTEEARPLQINLGTVSSLPTTVSDDRIVAEHIVKPSDCLLSTPSAQTGDWTVTTSDGSLTVSGSISGSTTATIWLVIPLE
jgi:hypothetical protein